MQVVHTAADKGKFQTVPAAVSGIIHTLPDGCSDSKSFGRVGGWVGRMLEAMPQHGALWKGSKSKTVV